MPHTLKEELSFFCNCSSDFDICCIRAVKFYLSKNPEADILKEIENYFNEYEKFLKKKQTCSYPDCNVKAIGSHIISSSSHLEKIKSDDGKIFVKNNWNKKYEFGEYVEVGVDNHQCKINCFCHHHDKKLFNKIDLLINIDENSMAEYFNLSSYIILCSETKVEKIILEMLMDKKIKKIKYLKYFLENVKYYNKLVYVVEKVLCECVVDICNYDIKKEMAFIEKRLNILNDDKQRLEGVLFNNNSIENDRILRGSIFVETSGSDFFIHSFVKDVSSEYPCIVGSLIYKMNNIEHSGTVINFSFDGVNYPKIIDEYIRSSIFVKNNFSFVVMCMLNVSRQTYFYFSKSWKNKLSKDQNIFLDNLISIKNGNTIENFLNLYNECSKLDDFDFTVLNIRSTNFNLSFFNLMSRIKSGSVTKEDCTHIKMYSKSLSLVVFWGFFDIILSDNRCYTLFLELLYENHFVFGRDQFCFVYPQVIALQSIALPTYFESDKIFTLCLKAFDVNNIIEYNKEMKI